MQMFTGNDKYSLMSAM